MTRRLLLGLAAGPALKAGDPRVVTDVDQLNRFATEYNSYVASLRDGLVDLRRWKRVVAAWNRMVNP
jgi:hypothetical protein